MIHHNRQPGVPSFDENKYAPKTARYCLLIPVINEGDRIEHELKRAQKAGVAETVDVVICDGGSTDGSLQKERLRSLNVNTLLVKRGQGRQGAQLRMGICWALDRGYDGVITIDGNDKDSIEDVPRFIERLNEGYAFVQGSRFVKGGVSENLPLSRLFAVRLIHAPVISSIAHHHFTDTTNGFRAYSRAYLEDPRVQPLRDLFDGYELLAYLSTRATQLGYRACEVPVRRVYPKRGRVPTKISPIRGNVELMRVLVENARGMYGAEGDQ